MLFLPSQLLGDGEDVREVVDAAYVGPLTEEDRAIESVWDDDGNRNFRDDVLERIRNEGGSLS